MTELLSELEQQQREKPKRVMRSFYVDKQIWEDFKTIAMATNLSQGDVFSAFVQSAKAELTAQQATVSDVDHV